MLWQLAWRQVGEAVFFGPGHVSEEEWCQGLAAFIRRNGRFDVIVCAEIVVSALSSEHKQDVLLKAVDATYDCPFDITAAIKGCARNFDELLEVDAIRILSMMEFDSYNMHASHRCRLDASDLYIVGWGEDFIRPKAELTNLELESFGGGVNDRWFEFVTTNRQRVKSRMPRPIIAQFIWQQMAMLI